MPAKKSGSGRHYGQKAQEKVREELHEMKRGTLRSGRSGKKVTSRKQAIAIALSEARKEGGKVPQTPKKSASAHKTSKKSAAKKSSARTSARRSSGKKSATRSSRKKSS